MTFYTNSALLQMLHAALLQTSPGDAFTLKFSWWDWRGRNVQQALDLLRQIAADDGLHLRLDVRGHRTLQVTKLRGRA